MFKKFISHYYRDEEPENRYQIMINLEKPDPYDMERIYETDNIILRRGLFLRLSVNLPSRNFELLEYHLQRYQGQKRDFLWFLKKELQQCEVEIQHGLTNDILEPVRLKEVYKWIDEKERELLNGSLPSEKDPTKRIKWRGSPALFGYIFTELLKHDYFDPPKRGGDINYAGFAKLCWEHFEINTTLENLIREMNPEKNSLSETKRAKFPDLSDLS